MQQGKRVTVTYEPQTRQLLVQGQPPLVIPQSLEVKWTPLPRDPKAPRRSVSRYSCSMPTEVPKAGSGLFCAAAGA